MGMPMMPTIHEMIISVKPLITWCGDHISMYIQIGIMVEFTSEFI
jgi:hypothetical protein